MSLQMEQHEYGTPMQRYWSPYAMNGGYVTSSSTVEFVLKGTRRR